MTTEGFNETLHMPHRLRLAVALAQVESAEFGSLRDTLGVADSVTSKHLKVLADAGYVKLNKPTGRGGKVRTWVRLTPAGRKALAAHLESLHAMVRATRVSTDTQPPIRVEPEIQG